MKSKYDVLGNYIRLIDTRNKDNITDRVLGINIDKFFMPSVANVIGTDLSKYKLITKGKFACNPMHVGRDERLPVALYEEDEPAIVSPAYFMFEIIDNSVLDENYLMMWFRRTEFDRICWLHTDGTVRGGIVWDDICRMELSIPSIEEQRKIVKNYKVITDRILLKQKINDNLEKQAAALVSEYCASANKTVELGEIMSFENGFAFQSKTYLSSGRYRIITIKNVQDGKIDSQGAAFIDEIPARMKSSCFLAIGDVLLSLTGNVGRVGIVYEDYLLLNQRVAKFVPTEASTLPWLYYYFRQPSTKVSLETITKGTAQQNLSPIETLKLRAPFEMESAKRLSEILLPMFNCEIANDIESLHLAELRDGLLSRLMSGELNVFDIDL